ncbi:MAG: DNA-formamidopyrimidine glycosylase [Cytophagales bacterium]|nr:DNA-formamidopyrimidine glycosylase [Cytophagales bacterium]
MEVRSIEVRSIETSLHQTITDLHVEDTKLLTTDYDELYRKLVGRQMIGTRRVGKNLFVLLDAPYALHLHFGMTGGLAYFRHDEDTPRFARIVFFFASGFRLGFLCPRKFERVGLVDDIDAYLTRKKIARDGLEITVAELSAALKRRKTPVKAALLDQATVAGLGNWIVDEVLFQAGVHPEKTAAALTGAEIERLHAATLLVLQTAIAHEAAYGRFPISFLIHAREWDVSPYPDKNAHRHCPRCGTGLQIGTVGGRTTYFCNVCQQ